MDPHAFRTIVSYVGFPLPDDKKKGTASVLSFIDLELDTTLEQIEDANQKKYTKLLESRTEKGLLIPTKSVPKIADKVQRLLLEDRVLKQADKELAEIDKMAKEKSSTHHILRSQHEKATTV